MLTGPDPSPMNRRHGGMRASLIERAATCTGPAGAHDHQADRSVLN